MNTRFLLVAALAGAVLAGGAGAETPRAPKREAASPFGALGGSGKEPIKIDADRLDVFDRESKAIFAGNVVAVQGDSTIRCSTMTVRYQRREAKADGRADGKPEGGPEAEATAKPSPTVKPSPAAIPTPVATPAPTAKPSPIAAATPGEGAIRQVECAGPVTVTAKDQVATGDHAVFDRVANRVVVTGNVVLSQCQNVTRGSRLVYDMNTGRANMDPVAGGRVSAMFVPGGRDDANAAKGCGTGAAEARKPAKPRSAQAN